MRLGVKVGDVMTRDFIYLDPATSISKCADKMIKKNVGSLIIKESNELMGLLKSTDILRAIIEKKDISEMKASDIMAKKIATIKPDKDIFEAIVLMNKKKTRQLPVINNNKVIGIITFKDILKVEPTLLDSMCDLADLRESRLKHKSNGIKAYRERKALDCGTIWAKEGQCDECGEYDVLYNIEGDLLCEECRDKV